jgi:hypothetical protein
MNVDIFSDEIRDIKNVLIDLQDEYPYIEGDLYLPEIEEGSFEIVLNTKDLLLKGGKSDLIESSIRSHKTKLKFINFLVNIVDRIENATHRKANIKDLFEWGQIESKNTIHIILE